MKSRELETERPDLLLLALKRLLLSHTGRPFDSVELGLGISPAETQALAERELELDLKDGLIVLKLHASELVNVVVKLEQTPAGVVWKVRADKLRNGEAQLSSSLSPMDIQNWCYTNISTNCDVKFEKQEVTVNG